MRYFYCLLGALLLLCAHGPAAAQGLVTGRVVDEKGQPVPYASVALADGRTGTATNEVGEFVLRVLALPQPLVVLSISYARAGALAVQAGPLATSIVLKASAVALPEVTVRANAEAEELVARCYAKLLRHQADVQYGRGFYRQKTRENGRYREFFDAFYDVKLTPRNMPSWVLGEARYAFVPGIMGLNNFSIYTRALPIFVLPGETTRTAVPLGPRAAERFRFVLRQTLRDQGRELAVVDFGPRVAGDPVASGTLYIDSRTAALFRFERELPTAGMFTSSNPTIQFGPCAFRITTNFGALGDSLSRLASTQVVANIQMTVKGVPSETTTTSQFFLYEYGPPTPGQKYHDTAQDVKDLAEIKKRRYHPAFWRDNAVVKDSPLEAQVIEDFEGRRIFGKL
ncbi:carboxypeptidase-like regulatory domain-containing protein [Hymenobacter nivis]|uniref:Carboxypeptidase-like regulatory domain-containing protein n=1 Tax=Hymenobacter nivis TaxID=1850093 RepID=A0A502HD44_9BACT|nr:carboxypeptidase-like regulatory domain-containing protein [Hymenobacter nivis]TPG71954.1 carboxypeptidase-like regulatory domain-containing protein [Hymenobacter nivis]